LVVPQNIESEIYPITITAVFGENLGIKTFNLTIDPKLEIILNLENEEVFLGGSVLVNGTVLKKTTGFATEVLVTLYSNDLQVDQKEIKTNNVGEFSYSYRTSFLENEGEWKIEAFASDELENIGFTEKLFDVSLSEITAFLNVDLVKQIEEKYTRGEDLPLSISLTDGEQNPVSGAQVEVLMKSGAPVILEETESGVYNGIIEISLDFPLGKQELTINALKSEGENFFAGSTLIEFEVLRTEILLEILEPNIRSVQIGEQIEFVVEVNYPNNKPVILSQIESTINGEPIILNAVEQGVYAGTYIVLEKDSPKLRFEVLVDDSYENIASDDLEIEVSGVSIEHYFRQFGLPIVIAIILILILAVFSGSYYLKQKSFIELNKKEKEALIELKNIQTEYFKDGTLDRKNYERLMEKYESQLAEARKSISQSKKSK